MEDKVTLSSYTQETSLHGIRFLGTNIGQGRKLFWAIFLLGISGFCLYNIVDTFQQYFSYDSYYTTKTSAKSTLELPAVSFCSTGTWNETATQEFSSEVYQLVTNIATYQKNDSETEAELASLELLSSLYDISMRQDKVFVQCGRGTASLIECNEYVTTTLTDTGVCYTFNGRSISNRLSANAPGLSQAIRIVLDLNLEEVFYSPYTANGFYVVVHDSDVYPDFETRSSIAKPGTQTQIRIQQINKNSLGKPYNTEECLKEAKDIKPTLQQAMDYYRLPYSRDLCLMECRMNKILFQDKCFFYATDNSSCTFFELAKYAHVAFLKLLSGEITQFDVCMDCLPYCSTTNYQTHISYADYPNKISQDSILALRPNYNLSDIKENIVELMIYYETLEVTTVDQVATVSASQLYSNIGGVLGLFLGASFISIVEFVDFMVLFAQYKINSYKKKKNSLKPSVTADPSQTEIGWEEK